MRFSPLPGLLSLSGSHVDKLAAVLSFGEHNHAVDEGEESVILTHDEQCRADASECCRP